MSMWKRKPKAVTGSLSYLDAGGEQTIFEVTGTKYFFISGMIVDTNTLTQNGTFKLYSKIDGTNYRLLDSQAFAVATDDGIILSANYAYRISIDTDFKLTYTESGDEGAARALPWKYTLE